MYLCMIISFLCVSLFSDLLKDLALLRLNLSQMAITPYLQTLLIFTDIETNMIENLLAVFTLDIIPTFSFLLSLVIMLAEVAMSLSTRVGKLT